jgi:hypothetical protein
VDNKKQQGVGDMSVQHDGSSGRAAPESRERACQAAIVELIGRPDANINKVCRGVVQVLPQGFRYPELCRVKVTIEETTYQSPEYRDSAWCAAADIVVQGRAIGNLKVCYNRDVTLEGGATFLPAESRLVVSVAQRLSHFIMFRQLKHMADEKAGEQPQEEVPRRGAWRVVLDLLKQTDRVLYFNIAHKMLNHLCWSGIHEAEALRRAAGFLGAPDAGDHERDPNLPQFSRPLGISNGLVEEIFQVAAGHLSDHDILAGIQKWIQEDKLSYFVQVANRNLPLSEVANAIRRFHQTEGETGEIQSPSRRGIKVSLIRRFFSEQLPFINIAKDYIEISDFFEILQRTIYSPESYGRLGGKCAGLHLARKVLEAAQKGDEHFPEVRVPRSWYITSDMMYAFMHYNNFDDIIEQKYKDREQIRYEYPFIVQTLKSSPFPPEFIKGISVLLDEFESRPLIVRSSSLLEDNVGAVFSGKYKSLFLPNQGSKKARTAALLDAVAEVYASVFSSDPIEYRSERGLLDFAEEMGIMIQEVVGTRVGDYHMPVFAGVAFSNNEFRWSPRIHREDGLLRIVIGLGTRAVDRLSDDYPVLIAPGQPNLRVNASVEEVLHYAPRYADVINLKSGRLETVPIPELLKQVGAELPLVERLVSVCEDDHLRVPMAGQVDFARDNLVVTFEGMARGTRFVADAHKIMTTLQDRLGMPVDVEFAHDGQAFHLLQCRPQCRAEESQPSPIPRGVPRERIIFTAVRNVTNGRIPDITHIIYVDPVRYGEVQTHADLVEIGRIVGRLNKLLPKRRFILMGPGRWGSRGDVKLGVSVSYADINNTAMMIEIARRADHYLPDLSFGTHFFQDLVESGIRYLPLYPDSEGVRFNEEFLLGAPNILSQLLPNAARFEDFVRVIDVPASTDGQVLKVLMNAELDEAVGLLASP